MTNIQFAKIKLRMPQGETVEDLKKELEERGFLVEITAVFLELPSVEVYAPDDFQIRNKD